MPVSPRRLTGQEFRELLDAILDAFPIRDSFAVVVRDSLYEPLDHITSASGTLHQVVHEVLTWAEGMGKTAELTQRLVAANPLNPHLHGVAAKLDLLGFRPERVEPAGEAPLDRPATFMDRESWYARRAAFELTVCRLYSDRPEGVPSAAGLLVAPDLVLTCGPNLYAEEPSAYARFNAGVDELGRPKGVPDALLVKEVVASNSFWGKKFFLLHLSRPLGHDLGDGPSYLSRGWLYLDPGRTASVGDGTYLLRHSSEGQIQFVFRDDSIGAAADGHIDHGHDASALAGSLIVSKDWAVIALHCGRGVSRRGTGIPIRDILDDLDRKGLDGPLKTPFQGS
ncbi:hypothetical protein OJF2_02160 [Aquisphaera giovannonii]|uniref:Effector-associated domain-containing protein n=1 Tax=Aquisphaera giovannonii TaxID=406548 RepID=A0A5B9VV89_9BACT|nr:effector-associated domain EAD1-containing protein [Aquisphaera giovannonii]QEH31751.1 hypothetical protein OJF2_02160 [Aquisphaera giovannonii]